MEEKNSKIVRNPGVTRKLLKMGCVICDVKPDKEDFDHKKSVFVFVKDEHFDKCFAEINEQISAVKTAE